MLKTIDRVQNKTVYHKAKKMTFMLYFVSILFWPFTMEKNDFYRPRSGRYYFHRRLSFCPRGCIPECTCVGGVCKQAGTWAGGVWRGGFTPPPPKMATEAGRVRPPGMHSCENCVSVVSQKIKLDVSAVADPGFSPGGCANSQKCYYFSNICRKLHENERIWTPRGGGARVPGAPP